MYRKDTQEAAHKAAGGRRGDGQEGGGGVAGTARHIFSRPRQGGGSPDGGPPSRDRSRRRIVVAETDARARAAVAAALRDVGVEIIEAGDGGALRAALRDGKGQEGDGPPVLDAVICDTHLDGLEDAALANELGRRRLILVAGGNLLAAADTAVRLGAAAVLRRPVDLSRLREEVLRAA